VLIDEIRNIKSDKSDLRKFGISIGIVFGILCGLLWWKGKDSYSVFLILSMIFISFGLVLPVVLKPLQKAWMTFAVILGWFMTRLILSVLFYVLFTGIGCLTKLFRKKLLDLEIDTAAESYWIQRNPVKFDKKNYERQF
jgi:hypothetical protein